MNTLIEAKNTPGIDMSKTVSIEKKAAAHNEPPPSENTVINKENSTPEPMLAQTIQQPSDEDLEAKYGPLVHDGSVINQMHFAAKFARDNLVLYDPSQSTFYDYASNTGLWQPVNDEKLMVNLGVWIQEILFGLGKHFLLKKRTQNTMSQILKLIRGEAEKPDAFQRTNNIIHVRNGVLHLDDTPPSFNSFSPDYYSRNSSSISFDETAECPEFLGKLLQPALSDDDISLLQRYAGQCLLGCNPSQRLLLLRGTAGGGKTTVANIIQSVIGDHNVAQLRPEHLGERFELAHYIGKTLLIGVDVPGDFLNQKHAHKIKTLIGGDQFSPEQKNKSGRPNIKGEFNVIITTNTRLRIRLDSDSGAWRRRLSIIDYSLPPTQKPVQHFADQLISTEGAGILNWCIEGAVQLLSELTTTGHIHLTSEQTERVETLLCESDSVRYFVRECVEQQELEDVTTNELLTSYNYYCDERSWQGVSTRQFENQIHDMMMDIHRVPKRTNISRNGKNQRGFANVVLR